MAKIMGTIVIGGKVKRHMKNDSEKYAFQLALGYILFAGAWILVTDRLLSGLITDTQMLSRAQIYKGLLFVIVTGFLLYGVINRALLLRLAREKRLLEANDKLSALIEASPLAIVTLDSEGRIMSWNPAAEEMFGWREQEVLGLTSPIVPQGKKLEARTLLKQTLAGKPVYGAEVVRIKKDGSFITCSLSNAVVRNIKGQAIGVVAIIADISEQKRKEEQLRYLSLHDTLTAIYNRTYFEQEMRRLQNGRNEAVGMIICDVDGLKLYNDSMGHDVGDELLQAAARVIKGSFRESDMVARIGGDEFAVLLPDTDVPTAEKACERIRAGMTAYNEQNGKLYLSMSVGFAVHKHPVNMEELYKEADNNMYREKLQRSQHLRNGAVHLLLKALSARDFVRDGHIDRMEQMVADFAQILGLERERLADVRLFARFHDIGKVAIPESIIMKAEPLTVGELSEMRRHPEVGHRIALSSPDLAPVADWILKHHEWWDGEGYPLGLKGHEIPLECRMLAIADAYDALTNRRPYREAKPAEYAYAELRNCAGRQFDPNLVEPFIAMMQETHQKVPM